MNQISQVASRAFSGASATSGSQTDPFVQAARLLSEDLKIAKAEVGPISRKDFTVSFQTSAEGYMQGYEKGLTTRDGDEISLSNALNARSHCAEMLVRTPANSMKEIAFKAMLVVHEAIENGAHLSPYPGDTTEFGMIASIAADAARLSGILAEPEEEQGELMRLAAMLPEPKDEDDESEAVMERILTLRAERLDEHLIQLALIARRLDNALDDLPDGSPSQKRTRHVVRVITDTMQTLRDFATSEVANLPTVANMTN